MKNEKWYQAPNPKQSDKKAAQIERNKQLWEMELNSLQVLFRYSVECTHFCAKIVHFLIKRDT